MPEICRFYGIIILMYFDEHNPPHFHVKYNEFRAIINIKEIKMTDGFLPKRALSLVLEWANKHKNELLDNWEKLQIDGNFSKIQPLE